MFGEARGSFVHRVSEKSWISCVPVDGVAERYRLALFEMVTAEYTVPDASADGGLRGVRRELPVEVPLGIAWRYGDGVTLEHEDEVLPRWLWIDAADIGTAVQELGLHLEAAAGRGEARGKVEVVTDWPREEI